MQCKSWVYIGSVVYYVANEIFMTFAAPRVSSSQGGGKFTHKRAHTAASRGTSCEVAEVKSAAHVLLFAVWLFTGGGGWCCYTYTRIYSRKFRYTKGIFYLPREKSRRCVLYPDGKRDILARDAARLFYGAPFNKFFLTLFFYFSCWLRGNDIFAKREKWFYCVETKKK